MATSTLRMREIRAARRVLGMCVDCGAKSRKSYRCKPCQTTQSQFERSLMRERFFAGFCVRCGRLPRIEPRGTCDRCAKKILDAVNRHRQKVAR